MRYQIQERIFRLGEDNDILNDAGQPVYQVDGKVLSIHGLMVVNDMSGNEVGQVSRKLVSLLATYEITLAGGVTAEVHQRFSSPLHPKWNISVAGGAENVTATVKNSDGSREGIRAALEKLHELPGLNGPISYTAQDHTGQNYKSIGIGRLEDGKAVLAN